MSACLFICLNEVSLLVQTFPCWQLLRPGPCPGSRPPSPGEGTCQPGQRPRWGMLKGQGGSWGGPQRSPPPPPPRLHQLEKEPLGLVALQSLHVWDGCVIPAASPGLWLLSFAVKFKNNNNFGPFPLTQCPRRCLCVLAIVHPWSFSWCWHLPVYPGTSSLLLTFAFAAL